MSIAPNENLENSLKNSQKVGREREQHLPELITVKETAEYLRIPLPTVYYLVQRGQLPAVQIGGRWRVKKNLIDRDILGKEETGQPVILIVDDEPPIQELYRLFLKNYPFSRVIVGTAAEAKTVLRTQKVDMLFLDLHLPDEDGDAIYEVARTIHPDMPIVIVTGLPESRILDRILRYGPVTVLRKPLDLEQLARTMRIHGYARGENVNTKTTNR